MTDVTVWAEKLTKTYRVYASPWDRLVELFSRRPRHQPFHALREVTFELTPGEGLGIIGENGAGKTTLLKILAGVAAPTSGRVGVRGKLASILELGTGFHPEFSGRQNIRLNAAMLGLSEGEVVARMPDIVAFSELGEFIDRPVKCYSTGMVMRLAFSIATQVDPEVLIVDEALSVGDGYFQKKCMDRLLAFVESGKTLLFCSHAMYYVSAFCRRALWLRHGEAAALGPVNEVVREYEDFLLAKGQATEVAAAEGASAGARKLARLVAVRQLEERTRYAQYEPWGVEIEWECAEPERGFQIGVGIDRVDGVQVCSFSTHRDGLPPFAGQRRYRTRLELPALPMIKGEFTLYVFLMDEEGLHVYDRKILQRAFYVESPDYHVGLVEVDHRWEVGAGERVLVETAALRR